MSLVADTHEQLWHEHQFRACNSPGARLLAWYASASDVGVRRNTHQLGTQPLHEGDGEAMRSVRVGIPQ